VHPLCELTKIERGTVGYSRHLGLLFRRSATQPSFFPEGRTIGLAAAMMAPVTSEAFQDHRVAHAPQAARIYPIEYLIDAPKYACWSATPRFHLGHKWQRIQFASAVKRRKNLFPRAYFHKLSCP
jgi:hypothetical protein